MVDASDDQHAQQIDTVNMVLEQIGAHEIGRIEVMNKLDLLTQGQYEALSTRFPHAVFTSTKTREGLDELIHRIGVVSSAQDELLDLLVPFNRGDIVSFIHQRCTILSETYEEKGTHLIVRAGKQAAAKVADFKQD